MARFAALLLLLSTLAAAQKFKTITEATSGTRKIAGFLNSYWDERSGKLWLEIDKFGSEMLYIVSLPAGVGSNDIGLDRGQLGKTRIIRFDRIGPRILMVEPNYEFRAISDDPEERKSVRDSFAESVIWGFDAAAEEDGRVLVDATPMLLRDAHGVGRAMQRTRQGTFRPDVSRSAIYLPMTKGFPRNTEIETTLTFTGEPQGQFINEVAPTSDSFTVRQRHSFVQLPDAGFKPREFDPRSGYFVFNYADYAAPIGDPLIRRFTPRHRLAPGGTITYYVDRGAPEPVRTALVEGARWWSQAFAAAGFPNGFKVEVLPEGADPMDVRYNVINWVHRATRGWSYGSSVTDPRTGEILKGHVTLGSLRVRQDYLIAEGVLAPYEQGKPTSDPMLKMGLARLRQLSAHEVGHTLGLSHAYSASTQANASVMDYPHPWVDLTAGGAPDLAQAYPEGIGDWDKVAITYGYRTIPEGANEREELNKIILNAARRGLVFLTDRDARPDGGLHPTAHLWDNGKEAAAELNRIGEVRARALARFDQRVIRPGAPMSSLEDALVPVYLLHRYQVLAASKLVGGADYTFALRGDGQKVYQVVPGNLQRNALAALLKTVTPEFLKLPPKLLTLIPPSANGYGRTRENFQSRMGLAFDPLTAAEASANLTVGQILHPERLSRLVAQSADDAAIPPPDQVIRSLVDSVWNPPNRVGMDGEIQKSLKAVVVYHLMALAANDTTLPQVRAIARVFLRQFKNSTGAPFDAYLSERIARWETNPKEIPLPRPAEPPPGQPIGCEDN